MFVTFKRLPAWEYKYAPKEKRVIIDMNIMAICKLIRFRMFFIGGNYNLNLEKRGKTEKITYPLMTRVCSIF
jgi:hypothetical protein